MPLPLVVDYLRSGGTLQALSAAPYNLEIKRGKDYPNLVLLKYDQIESPMGEQLVRECRGLILDESDNWRVVSRPFDKFFNLGEQLAAQIDWPSAIVQEKLDGSLMQLYWYDGAWQVGTSGTPDASGVVNGFGFSFAELFWHVWKELDYTPPPEQVQALTYLFELTTAYNRVVVQHKKNDLRLIGVRHHDGREYHVDQWEKVYPTVRNFPDLGYQDYLAASFATMNPLEQEGYVVVDRHFNRVKVKHPGYVKIHRMRDGFSLKRALDIVRTGESDEILSYFPEWTDVFVRVRTAHSELVAHLESEYRKIKHLESQKDFALEAVKTRYSPALFSLRKGHVKSIVESLAAMQIGKLMELTGIKEMDL